MLRCNGGLVSKATYSALYAVVGETASASGANAVEGNGTAWRNQFYTNKTQPAGAFGGWISDNSNPLPDTNAMNFKAVVTKSRVYLIGGQGSDSSGRAVYTAAISAGGIVDIWSKLPNLPFTCNAGLSVVTFNNKVYVITTGDYALGIYSSTIQSDGTLGSWVLELTQGGAPTSGNMFMRASVFITKNRMYICGGQNGVGPRSSCFYVNINTDGSLSGFTSTGISLPARYSMCCVTTKNYVYLIGGYDGSSDLTDVYYAPIYDDGSIGVLTLSPYTLTYASRSASAVVTNSTIYILNGTNWSKVQILSLGADGLVTGSTVAPPLPAAGYAVDAFITSSRVYCFGMSSETQYAPFAGGFNDYSNWNGTITPAGDPVNFKLPDTTTTDAPKTYTLGIS
jgi:hypothetical protein